MNLITSIENLGDMIFHIRNESNKSNIKSLIIKYSKYLYRIYYSLSCSNLIDFNNKSNLIKENVLPFRENYNIKKATEMNIFKYLFYQDEMNLNQYIESVLKNVLNDINFFINNI